MKTLIKIIAIGMLLSTISCSSTNSFAHTKKSPSRNSYPSYSNANFQGNQNTADWKFGADFGVTFGFLSATVTGTTDPLMTMLSSMSGISPFINIYSDYSVTERLGVQAKIGWERSTSGTSTTQTIQGTQVNTNVSSTQSTIGFGISIRYDITKNAFITAGPRLYVPIGSHVVSQDDKILTSGTTFGDGTQLRHNETTVESVKSSFGLEIGGGYRFPLSNSIDLVPRASFQFFPATGSDTSIPDGEKFQPQLLRDSKFQLELWQVYNIRKSSQNKNVSQYV